MIGEYVHYRYSNYLKYGIARKSLSGQGIQEAYSAAKIAAKRQVEEALSKDEKVLLDRMKSAANFYLAYHRNIKSKPPTPPDLPKSLVTQMDLDFSPAVQTGVRKAILDKGTGKATSQTNISFGSVTPVQQGNKKYRGTKGHTNDMIAIQNAITNINLRMSGINIQDPSIANLFQDLQNQYKNLEPLFNAVFLENVTHKQYSHRKLAELAQGIDKLKVSLGNESKMRAEIHSLCEKINYFNGFLNALSIRTDLQGNFAEELVLSAAFRGASGLIDTSLSGITKHMEQSFNAIDPNIKIMGGKNAFAKEKSWHWSNDIGGYRGKVTQEKADVMIWTKNSNSRPLRISVKNVNLEKFGFNQIHLLSGSSALQLLQEHEQFLNHYLNIVPERVGPNLENAPNSTRALFHGAGKSLILLGALVGGYRKTNTNRVKGKANVFVVLDNSVGLVRYYDMNEFAKKISNNIFSFNKIAPNILTGDFDKMDFIQNEWIPGSNSGRIANQRITKMLQQLHAMKLDVSMSADNLKWLSS